MKKIRMFLSAMAVLFAVAAAFVTTANPKLYTEVIVSYDGGPCFRDGVCDTDITGTLCSINAAADLEKVSDCQDFLLEGAFIED